MTIDIRGTTDRNKGAQLMLEAVVERLSDQPLSAGAALISYDVRARLGLRQTLHLNRFPKASGVLGSAVPPMLRRRFGLVADSELGGIVDASGFAYSDSFAPEAGLREAKFGARWERRGVPKVLLPQAFGPFETSASRRIAAAVLSQADLVFARDEVSLGHVRSLGLGIDVQIAPDFTIGLSVPAVERPASGDFVALVPNSKLVSQGIMERDEYLRVLARYSEVSRAIGLDSVVVLHENSDMALASELAELIRARVVRSDSPRTLKAVIGMASVLVGSRFHAVVGALSQGVPAVALGWSHKYEELLRDFGTPELLASPEDSPEALLGMATDDRVLKGRIVENRDRLLAVNERMWERTRLALGLDPVPLVRPPYDFVNESGE